MENNQVNLIINESHPFWLELEKYQMKWFQYKNSLVFLKRKSFTSFNKGLNQIVEKHNDNMRQLYLQDKDAFKEIYRMNSKFLDDQIKKEENLPIRRVRFRKIDSILRKFRPKFDNILADVSTHPTCNEFKDVVKLNVMQKALLYDYYFINPSPEIKKWMTNDTNYALILGLLFGVNAETLRSDRGKIKTDRIGKYKIQDNTKEILSKHKIRYHVI